MDEQQIQVLIQIRERLMIQLAMVSRLIDYYVKEVHGKPSVELLTAEQIKACDEEVIFLPDDNWVDDLEDYLEEEEDGEDY